MHNSLSPGFVKLLYQNGSNAHIQTLPVIPSGIPTPGDEPSFTTRDGTPVLMSTAMVAWLTAFRQTFSTTIDFTSSEFWYQPTPESDPIWIYTLAHGLPGTGVGAPVSLGQVAMSLRTNMGGLLRIYFMEPIAGFSGNTFQSYPFAATQMTAVGNFLISSSGFIVGRDGGYPVVPIKFVTKINDALRKRFLNL